MLAHILFGLCEHTSEINIEHHQDDRGVLLTVQVHKEDMGKVIGARGVISDAIKKLVRAAGKKEAAHVSLKFLEPDGSDRSVAHE